MSFGFKPIRKFPFPSGLRLARFAGRPKRALRRLLRKYIRRAALGSGLNGGSSFSALPVGGDDPRYEHGCAD
jgi:hypothetical protein